MRRFEIIFTGMYSAPNSVRTCVNKDTKESVKSPYLLVLKTAFLFTYSGRKWQL